MSTWALLWKMWNCLERRQATEGTGTEPGDIHICFLSCLQRYVALRTSFLPAGTTCKSLLPWRDWFGSNRFFDTSNIVTWGGEWGKFRYGRLIDPVDFYFVGGMQPSPQFLFQGCWVGFSWWLKVCHSSQVRDIEVKSATLGVRELSFVFAGDYCNYIWFLNSSSAISAPQISLNSSTPGRWLYSQKWLSCELMLESPCKHRKWHSFDSFVFCTCSLNDRLVISFLTTQSHKYLPNWISRGIFWVPPRSLNNCISSFPGFRCCKAYPPTTGSAISMLRSGGRRLARPRKQRRWSGRSPAGISSIEGSGTR